MIVRSVVFIIGVLEVLLPRRVVDFWMDRAVTDPENVEVRPWVYTVARLEGVVLVAWALYRFQSRSQTERPSASEVPPSNGEGSGITADVTDGSPRSVSGNGQDRPTTEAETGSSDSATVTITPGTRKFTLASSLYHAESPLTVNELVDVFAGTGNEMTSSNVSAALYTMHQDDIVNRRKRGGDGSFEYWLTDDAIRVLETLEEPIEPNPFPTE